MQQTPEDKDSLNLTAKRLLMGALGFPSNGNKSINTVITQELVKQEVERILAESTNTALNDVDIQNLVKREVESAIADVRRELDERLGELTA